MNKDELKTALNELAASFAAQGHALADVWQAIMDHAANAADTETPPADDQTGANMDQPPADVKIEGEVTPAPSEGDQAPV